MSTFFNPFVGGEIYDLDGLLLPGNTNYSQIDPTTIESPLADFSFDPSSGISHPMEVEYVQPSENYGSFAPDVDVDPALVNQREITPIRALELDVLMNLHLLHNTPAVSGYDKVTPLQPGSDIHVDKLAESKPPRKRRPTKTSLRDVSEPTSTSQSATPRRKSRNPRKKYMTSTDSADKDDKRKQNLEKNRIAASKCRVNRKAKIDQLQRDYHDTAKEGTFLRSEILRLKDETLRMRVLLLNHASRQGCTSPEDIGRHLNDLADSSVRRLSGVLPPHDFSGCSNLAISMHDLEVEHVAASVAQHTP